MWSCTRHPLKAETVYLEVLNIRLFTCIPQELVNYVTYLSCGEKKPSLLLPLFKYQMKVEYNDVALHDVGVKKSYDCIIMP